MESMPGRALLGSRRSHVPQVDRKGGVQGVRVVPSSRGRLPKAPQELPFLSPGMVGRPQGSRPVLRGLEEEARRARSESIGPVSGTDQESVDARTPRRRVGRPERSVPPSLRWPIGPSALSFGIRRRGEGLFQGGDPGSEVGAVVEQAARAGLREPRPGSGVVPTVVGELGHAQ